MQCSERWMMALWYEIWHDIMVKQFCALIIIIHVLFAGFDRRSYVRFRASDRGLVTLALTESDMPVNRFGASFTNSLRQRKPSFVIKIVLSGFTKDAQWQISTDKAWTQLQFDIRYSYTWPYWICICRSFPFRCKIYGRRVLKWIY